MPFARTSSEYRQLEFDDGTTINLRTGDNADNYIFTCNPWEIFPREEIRFAIDRDGLEWIDMPTEEVRVGDTIIARTGFIRLDIIKSSTEDRTKAGTSLADWVVQLIKEKKYVPPPISISSKTNPHE